jgi:predicted N-acetyltransferase YhbS
LGDHGERHAAFWGWVGEHEPPEPLLYLSHIGVTPERQGEGLGTALMRYGLGVGDQAGVPTWLETSLADNVAYYERFGFRTVVDEDARRRRS